MYYSPHILQIRIDPVIQYDESGNPSVSGTPEWKTIARCRCDDKTTKEFISENGHVYTKAKESKQVFTHDASMTTGQSEAKDRYINLPHATTWVTRKYGCDL